VALPLVTLLLMSLPLRRWPAAAGWLAIAEFVALLPYFLRNQTDAGNPVFPFAATLFGLGPWSGEQTNVWLHGHISDHPIGQRFVELWNQFFRFGLGENPELGEPWKPQWSILPLLSLVMIGFGTIKGSLNLRRWAGLLALLLLLQIAFWLGFTHLKSRFLLPASVPLALTIALGSAAAIKGSIGPAFKALIGVAVLLLSILPAWLYRLEAHGAPAFAIGLDAQLTGDALPADPRLQLGESVSPAIGVNHLLGEGSKVLLVGHATPLYFRLDRIAYQTTWDRGPLSNLMREFPDDQTAWVKGLRQQGFTHVLIDETMLSIWEQAGWNDPLLTRERVVDFLTNTAESRYRYPNGASLHELK
jgi:hypothetical protein